MAETNEQAERARLVALINKAFPADSIQPFTAMTGQRLLQQAREDANQWQNEPLPVLMRYAELCAEELEQQTRNHARNHEAHKQ